MNSIICHQNSCNEVLTPNVTMFEAKAFKEIIKVK